MDIRDEIQKVLIEFSEGEVYINKATDDILALFNVVGQSEQYFCCKDQIKQRCGEQCLGCYMYANDKV